MVSFENDKSCYYYMYTVSSEQKHLIVDQAEAKKRSVHPAQHSTTCAALQLKLTHGAFANLVWQPRPLPLMYACAHGAELT